MNHKIVFGPALLACLLSAGAGVAQPAASQPAAAAAAVKPGLWETTMVVESAATNSRRSVVGRTCIGAADAANLAHIVPAQREFGMQCENRDVKRDGASIVWTIACKSSDTTQTGKGKMSLFGESYVGAADLESRKSGAKPAKFSQSFSGKWLQACS
jgi:hypothetical protein